MRAFKCGHTQAEPANMGRGKAREARLQEYFNRKCLTCRMIAESDFEDSLTVKRSVERAAEARRKIVASYY